MPSAADTAKLEDIAREEGVPLGVAMSWTRGGLSCAYGRVPVESFRERAARWRAEQARAAERPT